MSINFIIKLLIFVGISLFLINKLISVLGQITEDNFNKNSHFGENTMKDVTGTTNDIAPKYNTNQKRLEELVEKNYISEIKNELINLSMKIPIFDLEKFINSCKMAWKMVIDAVKEHNESVLRMLIDKRFLSKFMEENTSDLSKINSDTSNLIAKVSNINFFGNEVFIKIAFSKTYNNDIFKQEWVFNKNIKNKEKEWYLSSIDES